MREWRSRTHVCASIPALARLRCARADTFKHGSMGATDWRLSARARAHARARAQVAGVDLPTITKKIMRLLPVY